MPYDATKMKDWQISEEAEKGMPSHEDWIERLGLKKDELIPMGRLAKLDFLKIILKLHKISGYMPFPLMATKINIIDLELALT